MDQKKYIGMDVHQASISIAVRDAVGKLVSEAIIETKATSILELQRIWRREGLKVPAKQKPRGRLWLNDGSCIRLRPGRPNHVWSHDFVEAAHTTAAVCGC